jgi:hypothetical protein
MYRIVGLITFFSLIIWSCASNNIIVTNKAVKVLEASQQITYPGIEGARTIMDIHVKVVVKKSEIENFDSCWVLNNDGLLHSGKLRVYKIEGNQVSTPKKINRGDTLNLYASYTFGVQAVDTVLKRGLIQKDKGEFWFSFRRNGKEYLVPVETIERKEDIYAP